MRNMTVAALVLSTVGLGTAAQAQDTEFRGFRAEAQVGGDRFQSQGTHDDKVGYGGALGFDGVIAGKWVVGPEFSYWRSDHGNTTSPLGGTYRQQSYQELGANVRAGYLVNPKLLVYGTGGYVSDKQEASFTGPNNVAAGGAFDNRVHSSGYMLGGGAEYSLTNLFYVGAGYRYSNYDDHTTRQRLFLSAGVHFKP